MIKKLEESPQPSFEQNRNDKAKPKFKGRNTNKSPFSKNKKNDDDHYNTDMIDLDKNALNDGNADMNSLNVGDEDYESKLNE